jgi:hypothetical protein
MPRKKSLTNFFVAEVFIKIIIFSMLLMINHVFIKQIFSAVALEPTLRPPPTGLCVCRGWGRSGSFHQIAAALVMTMKQ